MSQNKNKHQNHQCHNCQHHKQYRIGFGVPAVVQIEQCPAVTIPIDKYEELIRMAERTEIVARYILGAKFGPDKKMMLEILGVNETDEGGEIE